VELPPRSSNHGHGHQNEAAFYILEGAGYEIHDDDLRTPANVEA
jgi:quercetin dioxygenase-like cupin family protein